MRLLILTPEFDGSGGGIITFYHAVSLLASGADSLEAPKKPVSAKKLFGKTLLRSNGSYSPAPMAEG